MEAPRGWEDGPASPIATGPAGREEHAASTAPMPTTSDVRTSLLPTRCGARLSPAGGKRNIPPGFPRGFPDRCGQVPFAAVARPDSLVQMEPSRALYRFAGALEPLLAVPDAAGFEESGDAAHLERLVGEALALARRENSAVLEPALHAVDRRLLAVLERCRSFLDPHLVTFRVPELERWQHAAAAALAGARWGVAGLRAGIADTAAPLGRRYFAFLALAERHPDGAWPLFERYLVTPGAHHAVVAPGGGEGGGGRGGPPPPPPPPPPPRAAEDPPALPPAPPPAEVVSVVVPRAVDQDELDRSGRGRRDLPPHRRRHETVGVAVKHQHRTADLPHATEVVE